MVGQYGTYHTRKRDKGAGVVPRPDRHTRHTGSRFNFYTPGKEFLPCRFVIWFVTRENSHPGTSGVECGYSTGTVPVSLIIFLLWKRSSVSHPTNVISVFLPPFSQSWIPLPLPESQGVCPSLVMIVSSVLRAVSEGLSVFGRVVLQRSNSEVLPKTYTLDMYFRWIKITVTVTHRSFSSDWHLTKVTTNLWVSWTPYTIRFGQLT